MISENFLMEESKTMVVSKNSDPIDNAHDDQAEASVADLEGKWSQLAS